MLFNAEQFAAATKAPLDFALSYYGAILNGAERIVGLNIELSRSAMLDSMTGVRAMFDTQDADKAARIQAATTQALARKFVTYSQSVFEIAVRTQEDLTQAVAEHANQGQRSMTLLLEAFAKAAPVNSESAVAAIREFIAASNAGVRKASGSGRHLAKAA